MEKHLESDSDSLKTLRCDVCLTILFNTKAKFAVNLETVNQRSSENMLLVVLEHVAMPFRRLPCRYSLINRSLLYFESFSVFSNII